MSELPERALVTGGGDDEDAARCGVVERLHERRLHAHGRHRRGDAEVDDPRAGRDALHDGPGEVVGAGGDDSRPARLGEDGPHQQRAARADRRRAGSHAAPPGSRPRTYRVRTPGDPARAHACAAPPTKPRRAPARSGWAVATGPSIRATRTSGRPRSTAIIASSRTSSLAAWKPRAAGQNAPSPSSTGGRRALRSIRRSAPWASYAGGETAVAQLGADTPGVAAHISAVVPVTCGKALQ